MVKTGRKRHVQTLAFSDILGAPAQRFYNLVCLAYGADPVLFVDVLEKGHLRSSRLIPEKGPQLVVEGKVP